MRKIFLLVMFVFLLVSFVSALPHAQFPAFGQAQSGFIVSESGSVVANDNAVYMTGFYYSPGSSSWEPFTFTGEPFTGASDWVVGEASASLSFSQGDNYIIAYSCSRVSGSWDCHDGQWQLQIISVGPTTTPTCTDGQRNGDETGIDCGGSCKTCVGAQPLNLPAVPNRYLSMSEITQLMKDWSVAEPDILSYEVYGEAGGYDLVALRISPVNPQFDYNIPKVLVHSCIHGDEWIATASSLVAFHRLLSDYGRDDRVTEMFSNRVVYYVPVVNPVGYNDREREEGGRDPNRAFPYPEKPDNPPTESVAALISLFERKGFNAVTSVHADGRMVLLPLDDTDEMFEKDGVGEAHRTVARHIAEKVDWVWGTGRELLGYGAKGAASSFFFRRGLELGYNTLSLTLEVGTMQRPPIPEISQEADYMVDILTLFIEEAPVAIATIS